MVAVFGGSYWAGFKIKRYWALLLAPLLGLSAAGINLWVYFVFALPEKTDLAGLLGILVVAPVFVVIIGALDIVVSAAGAFFGIYKGRKN